MKKYELTLLLKADEDQSKFAAKMEALIKALEGKVGKTVEMGKKQLAYKIANLSEAVFMNFLLELPPASVVQLEKKLSVDKSVLRHLLVVTE